jgi:hypothetical protein
MADNELIENEREIEEDEGEQLPAAREGDDEDDSQDQEDGNDDDNNNDEEEEREINFDDLCQALFLDLPDLTEYRTPSLNDEDAAHLGASLHYNTHLKSLGVIMGPNLTTRGAEALGRGIQQSKIETLALCVEEEGTILQASAAPTLFQMAIQNVTSMFLIFCPTEDDAAEMGDALWSVNSLASLSFMLMYLSSKPCP